jgi:hypothetical protein
VLRRGARRSDAARQKEGSDTRLEGVVVRLFALADRSNEMESIEW